MVDTIEEAIHQATEDNDKANQTLSTLAKGCDEYLDKANEQKGRFEAIADELKTLNDRTIIAFNNNQEEAYSLLSPMKILLDACNRNISSLKKSEFAEAMLSTILRFQDETGQLEENIHDFEVIRNQSPQDQEWLSILSQL
ncbi:hypothetical protein [Spirosoma sp.]|uniref:hypothetical protein n=1 Tax=Spirosoma sp. TaxID=1899569 RepID=UPI002612D220|nr:hypothetical protein [Spirosoma sp.]MCX6214661.1 hypothetical protein [Spirosoma sp.]